MRLQLPPWAERVLAILTAAGYEAYAVGGCVRDALLDRPLHDIDVTTNATPAQVKEAFAGFSVIETGIRHGTVTVLADRQPVEITTYRTEGAYTDGRHPDSVSFGCSLEEDLSRRDFTVNAMAYNPATGLVDRFGGREDLARRRIRCVGDPATRFGEDALRVLRALRFSSQLDFDIAPPTAQAIRDLAPRVALVSAERVCAELSRMLTGKRAGRILRDHAQVLGVVIPEILPMIGFEQHNFHHCHDVLNHTAAVLEATPPVLHLRLAALFHDIAKPLCFSLDENGVGHFYAHAAQSAEIARTVLHRLRLDNRTTEKVVTLVRHHDGVIPPDKKGVKRKIAKIGKDAFLDLVALQRADCMGLAPAFRDRLPVYGNLLRIAREIEEENACLTLRTLAVDGNDLKALGYEGKAVGRALQTLLDAVIAEEVANEREALLAYLKT